MQYDDKLLYKPSHGCHFVNKEFVSAIHEWVEHSGSRSMREDIAGARARRRQQQPADAVCVIDCNGYRRDA